MATVYRKSAKGQHEIETRAARLLPRLRTALILVDGRRSDAELRKLIPGDADEALTLLLDGGFVELIEAPPDRGAAVSRPQGLSQPGGPTQPTPLTQPGPLTGSRPAGLTAPGALPADPKAFEAHRRAAVRMLNEKAGPMAEAVAIKLEKCRGWGELMPALQLAQKAIGNAAGPTAAAEFQRRFIDQAPA